MLLKFWNLLKENVAFRMKFFLCLSLVFNTAYSIFLFLLGAFYHSNWFCAMGIYFAILALLRFFIFCFIFNEIKPISYHREIALYTAYGWFLLVLNLVVSALVFAMIYKRQPIPHHEIVVIALATYTFTVMTIAIVNFVKYVKHHRLLYSALRIVNLISACVSMFTLANTMLVTFGEENLLLRSIVLSGMGGAITIFIVILSVYMITTASRKAKEFKYEKNRQ